MSVDFSQSFSLSVNERHLVHAALRVKRGDHKHSAPKSACEWTVWVSFYKSLMLMQRAFKSHTSYDIMQNKNMNFTLTCPTTQTKVNILETIVLLGNKDQKY